MFVIAKYHDVLSQLGLDSIEGVQRFQGDVIKNHKGRRDILRIRTESGPQPLVFFLKRNWKPYRKDGLGSFFSRGKVWSQSRVEWENSLALQRAGFSVAEPVAFGEQCGLLWEKFSFILTSAAAGERTVEEFLHQCHDPPERRRMITALGRTVRALHEAGFASPDLFTRHIFVTPGPVPKFCLIDMARLDRMRVVGARCRARDLAALHVTAPLRSVTPRERLRFFKAYGGDRWLRKLTLQRANYLLRRRKFADFSAGANQR